MFFCEPPVKGTLVFTPILGVALLVGVFIMLMEEVVFFVGMFMLGIEETITEEEESWVGWGVEAGVGVELGVGMGVEDMLGTVVCC